MKKIQNKEYVTTDVFDGRISRLEMKMETKMNEGFSRMKEGFDIMFGLFEKMDQKIDDLTATKADREDVFELQKRVKRLENKLA